MADLTRCTLNGSAEAFIPDAKKFSRQMRAAARPKRSEVRISNEDEAAEAASKNRIGPQGRKRDCAPAATRAFGLMSVAIGRKIVRARIAQPGRAAEQQEWQG